jgi:uncharacterized membrane protein
MTTLVAGLLIFFAVHSISIVAHPWRNAMALRLGEWGWKGVYGVVALIGLVLIVHGYAEARMDPVVIYTPPFWLRHVALLLLLPVFVLLIAAYLPGRIQSATKHPMLVATKLWAVAHLLANGSLADLLLFGGFLVWAVVDRISIKRRGPVLTPAAPAGKLNDIIAIVLGLALYVVFLLWLHGWLFGVSPIGRPV